MSNTNTVDDNDEVREEVRALLAAEEAKPPEKRMFLYEAYLELCIRVGEMPK